MTEEARLVGLSGEYGGKTFPLSKAETLIGRGEDCDLQIVDSRISRNHVQLRREGEAWVLEDLGSTHGTFIKGEQIKKATLQHGDTITIGETILRFDDPSSQDSIPTQMASVDDIPTVLETPDSTPTMLETPDATPTVLETPDATPTEMASLEAVSVEPLSPDNQPTQLTPEITGSGEMDICRQCGHRLAPDENFCGECGAARAGSPDIEESMSPPTRRADSLQGIPEATPPAYAQPPGPPPVAPPPALVQERKPFPWKWVAIGGSILVVALIVGVGLVLLGGLTGDRWAASEDSIGLSDDEIILTIEAQSEQSTGSTPLIPPTLTSTPETQTTAGELEGTPSSTEEPPAEPSPGPGFSGQAVFGGSAQIAFASDRSGRPQIYLLDLESLEERQLTDVSGGACQPSWSTDGSRLAYTSPCNTNREEYSGSSIFLMEVDPIGNPGKVAQLITTVGGGDYDPVWSRDGSRIAFTSWRTGRPQIFTVNPDGGDLRNLNDDLAFNWAPTWSNDGTRIAFLTGRGGQEEIWTVPTGGGEERRFSRSDGKDVAQPDWSPDGTTIVFEKIVGNIPRLIAAPVADGGVRELQVCQEDRLSLQPMGEPTWSPDGEWLAFETWPDGVNHNIALMRASCSDYRELTRNPGLDFDAAWRPTP
jgi:Tol biopolymer transport system component/pSer/pThr/pTyr-binding forkhead associated (FHA) protein